MGRTEFTLESDPVIEVFKRDVDRTLLRENLKLSPEERLQRMQAAARGLHELRKTFDGRGREPD